MKRNHHEFKNQSAGKGGALRFSLSFLASCALFVLASTSASAADRKVKAWRFEQRNQMGKARLYVCDDAIKVNFPQQNVQWNCSAPDWDVTITNYKLNIGKVVPVEQYGYLDASRFEFGKVSGGPTSRETLLFLGRPANKLRYHIVAADPIKEKLEMMYQTGSKRSASFNDVELVFSNWFKLRPEIRKFLSGLYRIADVNGILVSERYLYPGGKIHQVVYTDLVSEVQVNKSEFIAPKGFKFAYMHEIMQEDKKAEQMSGVIEDLFMDAPAKIPPAVKAPDAKPSAVKPPAVNQPATKPAAVRPPAENRPAAKPSGVKPRAVSRPD